MIGALVIDKPEGWTSHDVVGRLRRLAGTRRVGHTGTLDPFATGVLVVCVGRATRLAQLLSGEEKEYLARIRLGWATDTQDRTGTRIGDVAPPDRIPDDVEVIVRALEAASGEQEQVPPMYSAKKVAGTALYKHARAGREVARQPVRIRARLELAEDGARAVRRNTKGNTKGTDDIDDADTTRADVTGTVDVEVRVVCSAGTYVRTLAHDLGVRLGCGAHLAALRRTRVGSFRIENAITLERLEGRVAEYLIPPEQLVSGLPKLQASETDVVAVLHGRAVPAGTACGEARDGADCAILDSAGRLVAVARYDKASGLVRPRIVLADA